ncbi:hypothetical protein TcasGA2_TC033923 [Tribolium castaneum]|uniref:Uncharacterized protein n=1 Tax=Tribolium castaneum TaxID=7070 RepID=A0A139WDV6_TRICA|nr:hypothetical protein TcasGA2_TC033923 [Tribolium castaneum]
MDLRKKSTGDILTDAYVQATNVQAKGMNKIGDALRDIVIANNRYCEITERKLDLIYN